MAILYQKILKDGNLFRVGPFLEGLTGQAANYAELRHRTGSITVPIRFDNLPYEHLIKVCESIQTEADFLRILGPRGRAEPIPYKAPPRRKPGKIELEREVIFPSFSVPREPIAIGGGLGCSTLVWLTQ